MPPLKAGDKVPIGNTSRLVTAGMSEVLEPIGDAEILDMVSYGAHRLERWTGALSIVAGYNDAGTAQPKRRPSLGIMTR
jgi:hypothetical protein